MELFPAVEYVKRCAVTQKESRQVSWDSRALVRIAKAYVISATGRKTSALHRPLAVRCKDDTTILANDLCLLLIVRQDPTKRQALTPVKKALKKTLNPLGTFRFKSRELNPAEASNSLGFGEEGAGLNTGALEFRIGLWGALYDNYHKEPTKR